MVWSVCFAALAIWRPVSFDSLIAAADIYQLALGFALAAILLTCLKNSLNRYAVLGTSLAIISWTLGQLFWFSYTLLTQTPLPYPSVGGFGFTGTYFLLIGVLSVLEPGESKSKSSLLAFAILLAPLLLAVLAKSAPAVTLYNFVLGGASAWTVYKALPLRHAAKDRWLLGGILVLAATAARGIPGRSRPAAAAARKSPPRWTSSCAAPEGAEAEFGRTSAMAPSMRETATRSPSRSTAVVASAARRAVQVSPLSSLTIPVPSLKSRMTRAPWP